MKTRIAKANVAHSAYKILTSMYMIYRMSGKEKKPKEPTKTSEIVI